MVIALSSHLTHVKPSPPVVIDQPDLFTHLFQGVFSFFFCLPHNMGLVRKVCSLWGAFLWNTKDRKMWNCFFPKKMNSFIFMKKVVFTRFFSYTTLIWGSGDYWMGKQIQFIWLVRRRGGVGIRSWIYILQTTQNNIPQNDWFDFQAKKMWVWIASKLCCSSFCFALTSIRWTIDFFSEQGILCQRAFKAHWYLNIV